MYLSSSILSLVMSTSRISSRMVKQLVTSAIVHTIWSLWLERNQRYFSNKQQSMSSLFNSILAEVKLSYNLVISKGASSMQDFKVSRLFGIPVKTRHFTTIQEVSWTPPPAGCIKFNYDGSSFGSPPCGAVGVVIRDSFSKFLGAFAQNVGHATPLDAEFSACMFAMEKASALHLSDIWIETDSLGVVKAFKSQEGVPWKMKTRWHNCMCYCRQINCVLSHVLREGNLVADSLAKNGQNLPTYASLWWDHPPAFICSLLHRDSLGLPYTRVDMT